MESSMIGSSIRSVFLACAVFFVGSSVVFAADEYGTADEAKAMLQAAVAALKVNEETGIGFIHRWRPTVQGE